MTGTIGRARDLEPSESSEQLSQGMLDSLTALVQTCLPSATRVCLSVRRPDGYEAVLATAGSGRGSDGQSPVVLTLEADGATSGFLTVHSDRAFDDAEMRVLAQLGVHASALLKISNELESALEKARHLFVALGSREVIGQAKGIVMAEQRCSPDEAFAVLRERSQTSNRKLRDVAKETVERVTDAEVGAPTFSS